MVGVLLAIVVISIAAGYHLSRRSWENAGCGFGDDGLTETRISEAVATKISVVGGEGPPLIKNLSWMPARIVNSKIYDINVQLTVESDGVSSISIELAPRSYPGVCGYAFPREPVRRYILIPLDRGSGERVVESFSIDVRDVKGGREYVIKATVWDRLNRTAAASIATGYIREFENTAVLDDLLVAAYYYPWYSSERHWSEGYKGLPLLGRYDSRDPLVISKHIDWATGHGIDAFIISWWGPGSWEDIALKEYILKNPLIRDIKVGILYETLGRLRASIDRGILSIDLDDPYNREVMLRDLEYIADNYFSNPSYLRINGSPVVILYLARAFSGNVSNVIKDLRAQLHRKGYDVYLIGDLVYWQDPRSPLEREHIKLYDAVTSYSMYTNTREILEDFEENVARKYSEWLDVARSLGIGFVPSALPGFDDTVVRAGNMLLPKSPERFEKQLEIAITYIDRNLNMIILTSFNEWHEYTYIEPSMEDRYAYLEILRKVLLKRQ